MAEDPAGELKQAAASLPGALEGLSCNQTSFKCGKKAFLYLGPGAKGIGFKAMFKLDDSLPEAVKLASDEPDRYETGKGGWVTVRFTLEAPLPKAIWSRWLEESYSSAAA